MYCPKCGTENPAQAKFCKGCGQPLPAVNVGPPSWIWWAGLGVALLVLGGGLFLSGVLPAPAVETSPTTVLTTATPSALAEQSTPEVTLEMTLTPIPSPRETTATPTPTSSPPTLTPFPSPTPDPLVQCAAAPQQGLQIGEQVYVCTTHPDRLTLRAEPKRSGAEVLMLESGTALTIVAGPICADAWLWWQVRSDTGDSGWVAEGSDATIPYFICRTPPCEPVTGVFAQAWLTVQSDIGCQTGQAFQGFVAEEHFAGGMMFWREAFDTARSPVLFNNGTWRYYTHTPFVEGSPDFACVDEHTPAQCPPTPIRGFGMMWCDISELRNRLGNAVDCERGYQAMMQTFANGFMLRNDQGLDYVLLDNGTWYRLR